MLVVGLELDVNFVVLWQLSSVEYLKVKGHGFASVHAAQIPRVSTANSDLRLRVVLRLLFQRGHLTNGSGNLQFFGASRLNFRYESHFELTLFVNFKELFEAFFEDGVCEGVCHNIEAASLLQARFHLQCTYLINIGSKDIHNNACSLGAIC